MHQNRKGRHGQAIVLIAALSFFLMALATMAVDLIYAYAVKAKLVTAVDAAVLGAGRALTDGTTPDEQQASVNSMVQKLFDANFPPGFMMTSSRSYSNPLITDNGDGTRSISLTATTTVPTYFMRFAGYPTLDVNAAATAMRRDVNLMLVLDRSGSMNRAPGTSPGPTAFNDLKFAATQFVDKFDVTRDRLGLVSFGSGSHVDFAPATNFKTPTTTTISTLYAQNSGTNSPDGLWNAYEELSNLNDPTALNVIVFFTDGVATHFSGDFTTGSNPPGGCQNSQVPGVIGTPTSPGADWAIGLTVIDPGPPPVPADQFDWIPGCRFSMKDVRVSIPVLPLSDLHGTTILGSKSIPYWSGQYPITRGLNIKPIAENLTINTAARARQDPALAVRIYSIGLGGETNNYPADHELMRIVANDPQASSYSSSEPTGMYVYAPNSTQLQWAFQRVASEITRLIQ